MSNDDIRRVTDVLGAGSLALGQIPKVLTAAELMHALLTLSAAGIAEFNRATDYSPPKLAHSGIVDVSPDIRQVRAAIGFVGDANVAEAQRGTWERFAYRMVDSVVRVTEQRRTTGSQALWFQGMSTGHELIAREMLRRLKERVPDKYILAKSTISENADQRPKSIIGYKLFHELQREGTITTTILTDNASPFALKFKLSTQDRFEARALAALMAAQPQFAKNKALAEIGRSLGEHSPFAGWAFCSEPIEPIKNSACWSAVRAFNRGLPGRGIGNVAHLTNVAQIATTKVLTEPSARTMDEDVNTADPLFVSYIVPMSLAEKAQWETFSNEMRRWLTQYYPMVVPIFLSGSGEPDPRFIGSYWLQVSALFVLPTIPRPIQAYVAPRGTVKTLRIASLGGTDADIPGTFSHHPNFLDYIPGA